MKRLATWFVVILLSTSVTQCFGQHVDDNKGLKLPIRVTGTIPAYLELQTHSVSSASQVPTDDRTIMVSVRANCPWSLNGRLVSNGLSSGEIVQTGTVARQTSIVAGQSAGIACQVKHFAGEHNLQFIWRPHGDESETASTGVAVLQLWLETTEQQDVMTTELHTVILTQQTEETVNSTISPTPL